MNVATYLMWRETFEYPLPPELLEGAEQPAPTRSRRKKTAPTPPPEEET